MANKKGTATKNRRSKAGKGGAFERAFATHLSEWISHGVRDDIFWRTQNSGGRATTRRRTTGASTYGQYGDIGTNDPAWAFVIEAVTMELKRGYITANMHDLYDQTPSTKPFAFEQFLDQTITAHEQAGSPAWLLVTRRDHKTTLLTMSRSLFWWIQKATHNSLTGAAPSSRQTIVVRRETHATTEIVDCYTCRAADFWERVRPGGFIAACRKLIAINNLG